MKLADVYNRILGSLDNQKNNGFSARKLAALTVMVLVVCLHVKWFRSDRWEYIGEVLGFDLSFILVCLGLTTWQNIKENTTKTSVEQEKTPNGEKITATEETT